MKNFSFLFILVVLTTGMAHAQFSVSINSDTICSGTSTTLTASVTGGTSPYSYHWNSGLTTSSISVNPTTTTSYSCTVTDHNSLTANGYATVMVQNSVPSQPGTISGPDSVCYNGTGISYSVTGVAGVTYTWSLPYNWILAGGQGTNSITVNANATTGNITVTPSNTCGNGTSRTLPITVVLQPSQPSVITGSTTPCQGSTQTYFVTDVAGTTYSWGTPTFWTLTSGQGTHCVTFTVGANLVPPTLAVTPSNACGQGVSRNISINVSLLPSIPSVISGPTAPVQGSTQTYCVTNVSGVTYNWTVPTGWTITSGQGSNCINVTVGNVTGCITVTPSNACGNGPSRTLCFNTGIKENSSDKNNVLEIIPNPASVNVNIIYNDETAKSLQLKVFNLSGQMVYTDNVEYFTGRYNKTIALDNLPQGIYIVQFATERNTVMKKLMIIGEKDQ